MPSNPPTSSKPVGPLGCLGVLLLLPLLAVGGGLILRYAWDVVILHAFRGAPQLSLAKAIGLSTIIGYLTSDADRIPSKSLGDSLKMSAWLAGYFLLAIWILSFFIR